MGLSPVPEILRTQFKQLKTTCPEVFAALVSQQPKE
jgi:hypothetical protein